MTEELSPREMSPGNSADTSVSAELQEQLLAAIAERLKLGEVLISPAHFRKALSAEYQSLRGRAAPEQVRDRLDALVAEVNARNPATLVAPGIENWVVQCCLAQMRKQGWGITEVQTKGLDLVRAFARQPKVRALLEQFGLRPKELNLRRCHRAIAHRIAGREEGPQKRSIRLEQAREAAPPAAADPEAGLRRLVLEPRAEPSKEEAAARTQEQKQLRARIRKEQLEHLMAHMDTYVAEGKLGGEDAERLRQIHRVELAVGSGRMSREKGGRIRNSILSGQVRFELDRKVREATDYAVNYLQVFEALKRIDPRYDDGLRFLIRHKSIVNASGADFDPMPAIDELLAQLDCLHRVIELMDRQDAEVRMMAAHLPPYSLVLKRGQDRIENMVIEEEFVDELRSLPHSEMSRRLNAPERGTRVRAAVSMLCLNVLIERLIRATPFRKEIRLLKINLIIEEFYRASDNLEEARARAQNFLKHRLSALYPDMSAEETEEITQRSSEFLEVVEQRIVAERREAACKKEKSAAGAGGETGAGKAGPGVQIGRVIMRVAGGQMRLVAHKIMPDSEDPARFVLAKTDRESGEVVPIVRRGARRYVEKNREGVWEVVSS